jgi:ABC-2 type transport system permease protein
MSDIWTMIWKETKDSILQGGLSALIRPLLLVGILGIGVPWRLGQQWLALSPLAMGLVLYGPFTVILSFVGDAIAGERERHTLETLLASRISDRAILLGKLIVTTGYAWSTALVGLLLGLVVANLSKGQGVGSSTCMSTCCWKRSP